MNKEDKILNQIVFDSKTVSDLIKDVYESVQEEDSTIKKTIESILSLYANNDASQYQAEGEEEIDADIAPTDLIAFIAPTIRNFMDVSVKNKKVFVDLLTVVQRLLTDKKITAKLTDRDGQLLSNSEREEIIRNAVEKESKELQNKILNIQNEVESATKNLEEKQHGRTTKA